MGCPCFEDDAEYRYNRVLTLLEVLSSFGVEIVVDPEEYLLHLIPGSIMDDHPELKESLMVWKYDMVSMLRELERLA